MYGKRLFLIFIIAMSLLAAFGMWVMVDGAISYRNRTLLDDRASGTDTLSWNHLNQMLEG